MGGSSRVMSDKDPVDDPERGYHSPVLVVVVVVFRLVLTPLVWVVVVAPTVIQVDEGSQKDPQTTSVR